MANKPEREREREREFYSQLHCRHTRRAISPSKLVPILSNTYNERNERIQKKTYIDRVINVFRTSKLPDL